MSDFVKQCVIERAKHNGLLCVGIGAPITLLLLIVGMIYQLPWQELWGALLPLCIGIAIAFAFSLFQAQRFMRMVRHQETLLGITLSNEGFVHLSPKHSAYQSSRQWFMCTGSWAFHRLYIAKLTQQVRGARVGLQYYAHVETVDGKTYNLLMESASDLKRFYKWYKAENA